MKNQHTKLARRFHPVKFAALMAMLLIVGCFCGAFAASAAESKTPDVVFAPTSNITYDADTDRWVKVYDGNDDIGASAVTSFKLGGKTYVVNDAVFSSANAGECEIRITYDGDKTINLPARIDPKPVALNGVGTVAAPYDPTGLYEGIAVSAPENLLNTEDFVGEEQLKVASITTVGFESAAVANGKVETYAKITLAANDAEGSGIVTNPANYTVDLLPTTVTIQALELTDVEWSNGGTEYRFVYGTMSADGTLPACLDITATANDGTVEMKVMIEIDGVDYTLAQAYELGLYGNVYEGNTEESYTIKACAPNNEFYVLNDSAVTARVVIEQAVYNVAFPEDTVTYLGEADMSDLKNIKPLIYELLVEGENVPAEILGMIDYTYTNQTTGADRKDGASDPGVYTVTAKMPRMAENGVENYRFNVSELTATLIIKKNYIILGDKTNPTQIIVVGKDGLRDSISAQFSVPAELDRNAIRGYKVHKEYTLEIFGAEKGETFTLLIPVDSALVSNHRCEPLTADDLYLYDGVGNMVSASGKYKVTLVTDGDKPVYYKVENFSAASDVTFVVAPVYNAPFWVSAPGIALIILLVLLLLLVMFLVGLKLRQIERSRQNEALVIDTEGDVPAYAEAEVEEKIEDVDACLAESIDDMAEALREDVSAEEAAMAEADAADAVAEALEEVADEAAALELDEQDPEAAEGEALADAMAASVAEELQETVEAGNDADVADEVESAVADAMEENFNESADAAAAIALIDTDEDDDNDNDEDEDDDNGAFFGAFGAGLTYIDVMAEPEKYAEMLEQERLGEVQLVYRYRRSYQSRLAQSQGSVQDYYNIIKNKLLSYKGIKSRVSWNYEAFNLGRTHVAKFNAKTRTLYLYMALEPAELVDSKYGFADMSSKKKYASVPVLMKIKGDRKFKHALELITLLCEEKLGLQTKKVVEEVDYKLPYMTTDELVNEGFVKKLAAAIPMSLLNGETEEAPVEEAPVEEAPVEEAPVEEAPAEEIVEEIPADAEASDDEPQNV